MQWNKIWRVGKRDINLLFLWDRTWLTRLRFDLELYEDHHGDRNFVFNITLLGFEFDLQIYHHRDNEVIPA